MVGAVSTAMDVTWARADLALQTGFWPQPDPEVRSPSTPRRRPMTAAAVVRRLLDDGILRPQEVVREGIRAVPASRSHSMILVKIGPTRGFAIKQADSARGADPVRLDREAAVYRLVATRPALGAVLPACHVAEGQDGLLVLELVEPGETLFEHHHRTGECLPAVAGSLGAALGTAHRELADDAPPGLGGSLPWVLRVMEPGGADFIWDAPATRSVLATLPWPERLRSGLAHGRTRWRPDGVIHGDVKWDNCLLTRAESGSVVKLIDWELMDTGDPAWDVAGALQEYVAFAALTGPGASGTGEPGLRSALQRVQPALVSLWLSYRAATELGSAHTSDFAERSALLTGARLLQTSLEYAVQLGPQAPVVAALLEIALSLLEDPAPLVAAAFER